VRRKSRVQRALDAKWLWAIDKLSQAAQDESLYPKLCQESPLQLLLSGRFFVRLEVPRIDLSASRGVILMPISMMSRLGAMSFRMYFVRKAVFFHVPPGEEKGGGETRVFARDRLAGVLQVPEPGA